MTIKPKPLVIEVKPIDFLFIDRAHLPMPSQASLLPQPSTLRSGVSLTHLWVSLSIQQLSLQQLHSGGYKECGFLDRAELISLLINYPEQKTAILTY